MVYGLSYIGVGLYKIVLGGRVGGQLFGWVGGWGSTGPGAQAALILTVN